MVGKVTTWQERRRATPRSVVRELSRIPGVGPSIAADLYLLGIREVAELRGRDPERLYAAFCRKVGQPVDRCLLYVFRCAVYFASESRHDPELLKWWNWKQAPAFPTGLPRANAASGRCPPSART